MSTYRAFNNDRSDVNIFALYRKNGFLPTRKIINDNKIISTSIVIQI